MSSPWINELENSNKHRVINQNIETEVVIVGGGIAGIITAFYTLERTNKKVTLLEAFKLVHGATGHNAGQVVGYFERPFTDIAREFGLGMATKAQQDINSGWELLEDIIVTTGIKIDFQQFWGWAGCQNIQELIPKLENDYLRNLAGMDINNCLVDQSWEEHLQIPKHLAGTYTLVDNAQIKRNLNTEADGFIACLGTRKGTINSALLCEKVIKFLITKYEPRFQIFEHSLVKVIDLVGKRASLEVLPGQEYIKQQNAPELLNQTFQINTDHVILCTNGFENFTILTNNKKLNDTFQGNISGLVGYMTGYLDDKELNSTAITYFLTELGREGGPEAYFYLTRRKYGVEHRNLTCIGGPDLLLPPNQHYDRHSSYITAGQNKIDNFLRRYYEFLPKDKIDYKFHWHGLMGYTSNGLRMIGTEPTDPKLLYNLGCNGIGILPSIFGGFKIGQILAGQKFDPSIFDPK